MGTQVQLAGTRLFDAESLGVKNIKLFPGTNRDISAEQFAYEINRVLAEISAGKQESADAEVDCV